MTNIDELIGAARDEASQLPPEMRNRILDAVEGDQQADSPTFQLAQLNVARFRLPMDHPDMSGFVEMLDPMNNLADACAGLVWRLTDEGSNDATSITYYEDPLLLVNMSVWTDLASLRDYVYRSEHAAMVKRRTEWADVMESRHLVLWWVPAGHRPDIAEADARLEQLRAHGPTATAFTFGTSFPAPAS